MSDFESKKRYNTVEVVQNTKKECVIDINHIFFNNENKVYEMRESNFGGWNCMGVDLGAAGALIFIPNVTAKNIFAHKQVK